MQSRGGYVPQQAYASVPQVQRQQFVSAQPANAYSRAAPVQHAQQQQNQRFGTAQPATAYARGSPGQQVYSGAPPSGGYSPSAYASSGTASSYASTSGVRPTTSSYVRQAGGPQTQYVSPNQTTAHRMAAPPTQAAPAYPSRVAPQPMHPGVVTLEGGGAPGMPGNAGSIEEAMMQMFMGAGGPMGADGGMVMIDGGGMDSGMMGVMMGGVMAIPMDGSGAPPMVMMGGPGGGGQPVMMDGGMMMMGGPGGGGQPVMMDGGGALMAMGGGGSSVLSQPISMDDLPFSSIGHKAMWSGIFEFVQHELDQVSKQAPGGRGQIRPSQVRLPMPNIPDQQIEMIFDSYDMQKTGELSMEKLKDLMRDMQCVSCLTMFEQKDKAVQEAQKEMAQMMGPQMASMMSGGVSQAIDMELMMMKAMSSQEVPYEAARELLAELDADRDGRISKADFMKSAKKTLFDPNPPEEVMQFMEAMEAAAFGGPGGMQLMGGAQPLAITSGGLPPGVVMAPASQYAPAGPAAPAPRYVTTAPGAPPTYASAPTYTSAPTYASAQTYTSAPMYSAAPTYSSAPGTYIRR